MKKLAIGGILGAAILLASIFTLTTPFDKAYAPKTTPDERKVLFSFNPTGICCPIEEEFAIPTGKTAFLTDIEFVGFCSQEGQVKAIQLFPKKDAQLGDSITIGNDFCDNSSHVSFSGAVAVLMPDGTPATSILARSPTGSTNIYVTAIGFFR